MLTARGDVIDRVSGLELGADDYIGKPFEPRELVARIQTILRRIDAQPKKSDGWLRFEGLEIDTNARIVYQEGETVDLTSMEYELLCTLGGNAGQKMTRDEILSELRGIDTAILTRSVDIMVSRVRQKLGDVAKPARFIQTVWGRGYVFVGRPRGAMIDRLRRSLSFRLLAIFLVMGLLFAYGAVLGIRWVYLTDDLRELVNGHLSLHVGYVRQDIGSPPRIENALAITQQVPVDIRIVGPELNWASDPAFPELQSLSFGRSGIFSEEAEVWLTGLNDVEFATVDGHGFLKIDQGGYSIIVSSPKIADQPAERQLTPIIIGFGLVLVLLCLFGRALAV